MGTKIQEIVDFIENIAPLEAAEDYDNTGLIINMNEDIEKVFLCLDINNKTVDEAISEKANMIISHHPILFKGIKKIDYNTQIGKILIKLIKNNISVYSSHTNFDSAPKGLNYYMCRILGFQDIRNFKKTGKELVNGESNLKNEYYSYSMGKVAKVKETALKLLVNEILIKLDQLNYRIIGDKDKRIKNILVSTGVLSPEYINLVKKNIDLIITGEVKYHDALLIKEMGICILELGHFGSEIIFREYMEELLSENIKDIEIVLSKENDIYCNL